MTNVEVYTYDLCKVVFSILPHTVGKLELPHRLMVYKMTCMELSHLLNNTPMNCTSEYLRLYNLYWKKISIS